VVVRLRELAPLGFDACIDAAGFHSGQQFKQKVMKFMERTTEPEIMKEAAMAARKGGIVCVIGEYYQQFISAFPIGAFLEKGLQLRAGHVPVQKYWAGLLNLLQTGQLDPLPLVSHSIPIDKAPAAYVMFNKRRDDVLKVVLRNQTQA